MLERMKAYKELVELEKNALLKSQEANFEQEKKRMTEGARLVLETLLKASAALVVLTSRAMPYTPKERRKEIIESLALPAVLAPVKEGLERIAEAAPLLPQVEHLISLREILDLSDVVKPPPLRKADS